jgi:hypothetical protein
MDQVINERDDMTESRFSTEEFISSAKPWDYMVGSGVCEPDSTLSAEELNALHGVLNDLDELHLGFALVLGENFAPELFAPDAARLLGHPDLGVRVNAYRVLRAVPVHSFTDILKEAVIEGLSRCPERDTFADTLPPEPEIADHA